MGRDEGVFEDVILDVIIRDVVVNFYGWGEFLFFVVVECRDGDVVRNVDVFGDVGNFF